MWANVPTCTHRCSFNISQAAAAASVVSCSSSTQRRPCGKNQLAESSPPPLELVTNAIDTAHKRGQPAGNRPAPQLSVGPKHSHMQAYLLEDWRPAAPSKQARWTDAFRGASMLPWQYLHGDVAWWHMDDAYSLAVFDNPCVFDPYSAPDASPAPTAHSSNE